MNQGQRTDSSARLPEVSESKEETTTGKMPDLKEKTAEGVSTEASGGVGEEMPRAVPGDIGGANPGGESGKQPDLSKLLSDPEIIGALKDAEVSAAFEEISSNPASIAKYQNNPKVKDLVNKMAEKFNEVTT